MRRFGLCLDYNRNIWKSFYNLLRKAKSNAGREEEIYQIDLMPAEAVHPSALHMIVSNNENTSHLEDLFMSLKDAQEAYAKTGLNLAAGLDIMPIWRIFKVNKKNNKKEKVFEFKI